MVGARSDAKPDSTFADRALEITGRFASGREPRSGQGAAKIKKGRCRMFQGHIDQDTAIAVEASAIPDVLFERGLYWASGRSGVVNLVAAHKWFNLAALKGRTDAIQLRREVAELMSEVEIAMAQREARAWMTTH
jgi:TPR repeat protein